MDPRPLTASVIGCGTGGRLSLEALWASPLFRIVAAADLRPKVRESLERECPGLRTFGSHQEMLAHCPSDVVCVSTYAPSHESIVLDAIELSPLRGILVEKPLADTAAAGQRILDAIKSRNLPVVVPHGLRTRATSTRTYRDGMQVETVAVTYIENVRGVRMILQTGDFIHVNTPGKKTLFRLAGTGGIIEFWGWEKGYSILNAQYPAAQMIVPNELPVFGHRRHLENLAMQIGSGTPDYRLPESSLTALEICEAAFLSSHHRCQVHFPLASFDPPVPSEWEPGKPYSGSGGGRDGRKLEEE